MSKGWPDRLDRGPFKRGWDCEKRRGIAPCRWIHIADKGIGDLDRAGRALELQWDHYGFATEEIEEQMQCFAEEIMPVIRQECGGLPEHPDLRPELEPLSTATG